MVRVVSLTNVAKDKDYWAMVGVRTAQSILGLLLTALGANMLNVALEIG